jgi:AcrR family transcriptional regulator
MLTARRSRKDYSRSEQMRAAFMAGAGASAAEIADALGTTPGAVYWFLSKAGLRIVRKTPHEICFPLVIRKDIFDLAGRVAANKGLEPCWFLSKAVERLLSDKELMALILERHFK